ncbi:hypothetical protein LEP1GSC103_1124 [Leptospira borgpetersenii serovar Javanica str. UI 09931]|uniref:Uncharacterized protein n=5 Tax=Leptospira borgpetersenii TaxID=174 RepID=M3FJC1_LEPBO|nr:hypothetical protein LBBP_02683 [Leptospira borgpetersenii serovar Ballum]EKP14981.1 hypothetical protein LEP1GSC128_2188 [Leptospira borgpetersenii str. 200801926]EKQ90069.1 hypothetical protein LEP1GSC101_2016 [Leptospira borgpetersenii str. UI 09149]EKQ99186.1 hypothetical protein LEP1GSC121_2738 [Leptospira borgpetersenii serovar Castellonis str. 200801910]EMG01933.1 hypothetical protein LEP1GSC123_0399 [Leptospira borgpetersenii str. 200701203]EMK12742.1 hypothetical protein LEP1GSC066
MLDSKPLFIDSVFSPSSFESISDEIQFFKYSHKNLWR